MPRLRTDQRPAARARSGVPTRLWTYLANGPRRPIAGTVDWAYRLALSSAAAHVVIFAALVLGGLWGAWLSLGHDRPLRDAA